MSQDDSKPDNVLPFPVRLNTSSEDADATSLNESDDWVPPPSALEGVTFAMLADWLQPHLALADEQKTLGAMMSERSNVVQAMNEVTAHDFADQRHCKIFKAMVALYERGEDVIQRTIYEELLRRCQSEDVGGVIYLRALVEDFVSEQGLHGVTPYTYRVARASALRQLQDVAAWILKGAAEPHPETGSLLWEAKMSILDIRHPGSRHIEPQPLIKHVKTFCDTLSECYKEGRRVPETATGLDALDDVLGGLHPNTLTIIVAPTGNGKTDLCLNIALHMASLEEDGEKIAGAVAFFSSEVSNESLVRRMVGLGSEIDPRRLYNRSLSNEEWQRVNEIVNRLAKLDIQLFASPWRTQSLAQLRATVAKLEMNTGGLGCIMVDGLPSTTPDQDTTPTATLRALKVLAREYSIPIIATLRLSSAPVSRSVNKQIDLKKRLAEWGAVEDEADTVIFLSRPNDANRHRLTRKPSQTSQLSSEWTELWIAKHRNGASGTVRVGYTPATGEFFNSG